MCTLNLKPMNLCVSALRLVGHEISLVLRKIALEEQLTHYFEEGFGIHSLGR
jgi:hypothetical protein